ncbi:3-hydroxyacyl-CoA dehydrogenase family protein [Archaeoglobus neptunius]|uniref:3-hydroxyacyl-CoA dehydrogenase family protein n=1 Tax=Archaeoglobus neptunius TaxID=2798580 RepID=UPI001928A4E4|nr:3-hydroxyacyl-CoA dehydrogenase family protein [Archaeoglobus neptunius]
MRAFVAGAGLMGQGIAVDLARRYDVLVYDISEQALENARKIITGIAEKAEVKGKIEFTTSLEDVKGCDVVVESVFENLEVKVELLRKIEKLTESPICSNTSVIVIDDIAERLESKERFLGVHWMNPPHIMPLVEIILSSYTDNETVRFVDGMLRNMGKKVVYCRNRSLVNRFNAAVLSESSRMIEEGVSFEDIDSVWKYHLGILYTLFGPLGNLDHIGLDVVHFASQYLYERYGDEKYRPSNWLLEKVQKGELGVKTGRGIYQYRDFESAYEERIKRILALMGCLDLK